MTKPRRGGSDDTAGFDALILSAELAKSKAGLPSLVGPALVTLANGQMVLLHCDGRWNWYDGDPDPNGLRSRGRRQGKEPKSAQKGRKR